MPSKSKTISLLLFICSIILLPGLSRADKPLPPLQVTIIPVNTQLLSSSINPGDVVDLKIIGRSLTDAQEIRLEVELKGDTELVSGDTAWKGSLARGQEAVLLLTVRAPRKGRGLIKARMIMQAGQGASFSAEDRYVLGPDSKKKPALSPSIKKDKRGRNIIEVR